MSQNRKPNIVIILADDMGIGDLGCYNPDSKIPTPNMDAMQKQGMMFCDAHSSAAVCTPSRYSLLTGRYCWRSRQKKGVLATGYTQSLIEPSRTTVASMLKKHGYDTAAIGKWHIGMNFTGKDGSLLDDENGRWTTNDLEKRVDFTAKIAGGPIELGFDYFYGNAMCPTAHSPYAFIENDHFETIPTKMLENPVIGSRAGMMAEGWEHKKVDVTLTEHATQYIRQKAGQENPFFLYLAADAPHEPCVPEVVPEFARGKSEAGSRGDLVWLFDWMVGQVNATLQECGIADNTIVIVTSDNGALAGERIRREDGTVYCETYGHKVSAEYRGNKAQYWEGGHREPMLIQWPAVIEKNSVCNELVGLFDLAPTLEQIVEPDTKSQDDYTLFDDAVSFKHCLVQQDGVVRTNMIHHSGKGVFALRYGKWKFIINGQTAGGWTKLLGGEDGNFPTHQLYDLSCDPAEQHNVYEQNIEIGTKLEAILQHQIEKGYTKDTCCTLQAL